MGFPLPPITWELVRNADSQYSTLHIPLDPPDQWTQNLQINKFSRWSECTLHFKKHFLKDCGQEVTLDFRPWIFPAVWPSNSELGTGTLNVASVMGVVLIQDSLLTQLWDLE